MSVVMTSRSIPVPGTKYVDIRDEAGVAFDVLSLEVMMGCVVSRRIETIESG
jgi:hypothetical protein